VKRRTLRTKQHWHWQLVKLDGDGNYHLYRSLAKDCCWYHDTIAPNPSAPFLMFRSFSSPLLVALDHVLPFYLLVGLAVPYISRSALPYTRADRVDRLPHTTEFVLVLKEGDVRRTHLVRGLILLAPLADDITQVRAGVFSLNVVAHIV
jgi:hypothetical protein